MINNLIERKRYLVEFIIILLLGLNINSNAQPKENDLRKVIIQNIIVNKEKIPEKDYNALILSTEDSISINYFLDAKQSNKTPFMFRIKLYKGNISNVKVYSVNSISYANLFESEYRLVIEAFDPQNKWIADSAVVLFRVNNNEAKLIKELYLLRKKPVNIDTVQTTNKEGNLILNRFHLESLIIGFLIGGLILFILSLLLFKNRKTKIPKFKGAKTMGNDNLSINEKYERLQIENSNLRAEIASLRGQIDAMQNRSEELNKQNKDLKDSVERLSLSKKELEDLQKQKDDLFAVIIHDIKNPASLIKSLVELLKSYDLTASEQQEVIDDIVETTKKIVTLSQQVTRILALESTSLKLNLDSINVNEVIKDVVRRNSINAKSKSIEMILELNENIPEAMLDAQKVEEIVDNLVSNALKFSHSGGQIRVLSKYVDRNIVVEISDNGLGLTEEDVQKAFQRGSKLSASPTGGESSSGFGLWIVKKLAEAHNGKVWVVSTVGKGSTFAFSLPVVKQK